MRLQPASISTLLGPEVFAAMRAGGAFLQAHDTDELLARVGQRIEDVPPLDPVDKRVLPASYGGDQTGPCDDFLVGRGLFFITEQGRLLLDCTSGHYQMPWGYNHPRLCRAIDEAVAAGVVWDNHSNIPQTPVKRLAHRLLTTANVPGAADPIDKVLIGVATGSSAAAAALKMQLVFYQHHCGEKGPPVVVVLDGNYHGTDMFTQYLRGMWQPYVTNLQVATVQPNDEAELQAVFDRFGGRVAGFWAEPIMMNREAIRVEPDYLKLARQCCDAVGAAMCLDEIQTGFWQPKVLACRSFDFTPDMIVVGKGMSAGFHPLSALLFKRRYDLLEQYDALNTNGGASLASYVGLCCLDMVESASERIVAVGDRIMSGLASLAAEFSDVIEEARGYRHLAGLKFRRVADALDFHRRAVDAGLWVRAHAYHEGHSTVLTKLGLEANERIVDFMVTSFRSLLQDLCGGKRPNTSVT